jgi:ATP-dependent DNA helicase UvrD/PcrA
MRSSTSQACFVSLKIKCKLAMASILLALKPCGRGLTVVGDDAQSIYSFRAATVRNILDFPAQFAPSAAIITLDRNYRSTGC